VQDCGINDIGICKVRLCVFSWISNLRFHIIINYILGGLGYLISRNVYLIPGAVLIVSLVSTYTVFNSSFLMWVVIYTILSYIIGLAVKKHLFQ
jgi:hypothetical protein